MFFRVFKSLSAAVFALAIVAAIQSPAPAQPAPAAGAEAEGLRAFRSEAELERFLTRLREREERRLREEPPPPPAPPPPPVAASAPAFAADGITNNQTAGVDEGGIVKARGDLLVILRRGRLFTVSIAGGENRPVDMIDAFPPGTSGYGSWYDEMLIAGDRVVVIGYSYARGGTEISRFRLSDSGELSYEDTHHLRSNDYYSTENYASRLIGNRLIFYAPLNLFRGDSPWDALPGVKRWNGDEDDRTFRTIAGPRQIFVTPAMFRSGGLGAATLHSVTSCDVSSPEFDCTATGAIGGWGREFYVSGEAVYLWVVDNLAYLDPPRGFSHIYRLPLDGGRPSAIGARGYPENQFAFREDAGDGVLNVLVRAGDQGLGMWEPEAPQGTVALLRVPLDAFGDGSEEARQRYYRLLPPVTGYVQFENRFVGDHVVYGYGSNYYGGEQERQPHRAVVVPLDGGPLFETALDHRVERIEQLGADAVIVGSADDGSLGFTAVELTGTAPRIGNVFMMPSAAQGESRSHAYFYRPDPDSPGGASGLLGLPVARAGQSPSGQLFGSAAAMLFLRRDDREFSAAGELAAHAEGAVDDSCQASCTDWYGNARPIFLRDRILALLGYELVEGSMEDGRIREIGRVDFAPAPARTKGGE